SDAGRGARWFMVVMALLCLLYLYGLTREIAEPWVGRHDWNGAFFSQLARNFLRYPFDIHHGMPIVAAGEAVPALDARSVYDTQAAALVWLVAGVFQAFGATEWVARLVPITFSLAAYGLLLWLITTAWGPWTAAMAGLF